VGRITDNSLVEVADLNINMVLRVCDGFEVAHMIVTR